MTVILSISQQCFVRINHALKPQKLFCPYHDMILSESRQCFCPYHNCVCVRATTLSISRHRSQHGSPPLKMSTSRRCFVWLTKYHCRVDAWITSQYLSISRRCFCPYHNGVYKTRIALSTSPIVHITTVFLSISRQFLKICPYHDGILQTSWFWDIETKLGNSCKYL